MLREDELFVINALCADISGTWLTGEDPPDAYLSYRNTVTAVEISTLTQHVTNELGTPIPRLSQDAGVVRLCDELNDELNQEIPSDLRVILTLHSPIARIRKFKEALKPLVIESIKSGASSHEVISVQGNEVRLHVVKGEQPSGKKIVGMVVNKNSSADIFSNCAFILRQRIEEKTKKCANVTHRPLWLALFNDYWLADERSYEEALKTISIEHPFEKIFLVNGKKNVHEITKT